MNYTPDEVAEMVRRAVEAECERCARVCESFGGNGQGYIDDDWAQMCADAIRDGRAQQPETQCGEELPSPLNGDFDCPKAAAARSCPCGFCRALRTPNTPVELEDGPIDASDNAEYIERCADRLERCGLRVTAGALRVIAHEHRTLAQQQGGT